MCSMAFYYYWNPAEILWFVPSYALTYTYPRIQLSFLWKHNLFTLALQNYHSYHFVQMGGIRCFWRYRTIKYADYGQYETSVLTPINMWYFSGIHCIFVTFSPAYISGTVAIILVVMISLLCAVMVLPLLNKSFSEYILSLLTMLAVGCLCGDAIFHLIPHVSSMYKYQQAFVLSIDLMSLWMHSIAFNMEYWIRWNCM